mmetsp:Transcript_13368/g.14994  ORF Transcript_13368/g.14994 Transcript_13368/m.14994 type:complete len:194 (+) Transcript_13368:105-686(+)
MAKGDLRSPEFKKINPSMQIPALTEGDFKLSQSHSILKYLHKSRGCADHWYPSDPKKRSIIDQDLDWHHSNLRKGSYQQLRKRFILPLFGIEPNESELAELDKLLHKSLRLMDKTLKYSKYCCGDQINIVDLSLGTEINSLTPLGTDMSKYPYVQQWMKRLEEIPEVKNIFDNMSVPFLEGNNTSAKMILSKI